MWAEHCLICKGADPKCPHEVDLLTIQIVSSIFATDFNLKNVEAKKSYDIHKSINRYLRVSRMTENDFNSIMSEAQFTFAKTMPKNPHHYTLLKTWKNRELWFDIVLFISMHTTEEIFGTRSYDVYFASNGYKYWSMDPTLDSTDLINRKEIDADR